MSVTVADRQGGRRVHQGGPNTAQSVAHLRRVLRARLRLHRVLNALCDVDAVFSNNTPCSQSGPCPQRLPAKGAPAGQSGCWTPFPSGTEVLPCPCPPRAPLAPCPPPLPPAHLLGLRSASSSSPTIWACPQLSAASPAAGSCASCAGGLLGRAVKNCPLCQSESCE